MSHFAKSQLSLSRLQHLKTLNMMILLCSECPVEQLKTFKIHGKGLSTIYIEMAYPSKLQVEKPE